MDLTEAGDIKKRWQEYTEELYKKDLHDPDNHDGMITNLEPDILECEVKWAYFIDYAKAFDCLDHNKLWKILKQMGIPHHLTCLLRNLYAGQEATVRSGHGITDWFQIGKEVCQGCILSPCLFNLYSVSS